MRRILSFHYLKRKHFRDTSHIRSIANSINNSFDHAYTAAATILEQSINETEMLMCKLSEQTNEILSKIEISGNSDLVPSPKEVKLFADLYENESLIESNKKALLSLSEMKIVFLFKTIENTIKEMIVIAFPKVQTRSLFRWKEMEIALNINGVEFDKLYGYDSVNHLRIVNNNIKHSSNINEATKQIMFRRNETGFTYKNLEIFYKKIHKPIIKFMKNLGEAIIAATYEVSDEKLEDISKELFDRLDRKNISKLIINLEERLKENPNCIQCKNQPL